MEDAGEEARGMSCLEKTSSTLSVNDVYEIAQLMGAELERLIDSHGRGAVEGLVSKVVRVLELLESFVSRKNESRQHQQQHQHQQQQQQYQHQELLTAIALLQAEKLSASTTSTNTNTRFKELENKSHAWHKNVQELQKQISQLTNENQQLVNQLIGSQTQEDSLSKKEREVMLKLKEVVDRQRDELRAKDHEIYRKNDDVEALQQQLDRVLKVNNDLRHKNSVMQAQMKSVLEKKAELEVALQERNKEIDQVRSTLTQIQAEQSSAVTKSVLKVPDIDLSDKIIVDLKDPNRPCFTKQEMRQILHERNELKTNLFLVQEELTYYQREILNDEKCPVFFMETIKTAMQKQRKKVKAKMLGIPESMCSSDEEEKDNLVLPCFPQDEMDSKPRESKIRTMFGFLYRKNNSKASVNSTSPAGVWEVIEKNEVNLSREECSQTKE
uniref:RILP-like protein 2 n=1 Tax=Callorhinchus milii TaxID=7868 RepID=V9KS01_CALMI|eukprot:gi/632988107/ref/XP_007882925.1/ PREDICTED: RILP-like protein 1 [Callorhinchus milii]